MGRWQFVDDINECSVEEPWMPLSQYPPCMTGNERTSAELLVDDASHPKDIVANVRRIMSAFKPDDGDDLEGKVCSNLGVGDLRKYFQSSSKFFSYHFRQYSKSRREAPIYWPISTESGFYTLWFYYHRLTDQTLYKAINDFVDPKLTETGKQLANLPPATAGGGGGGHGKKGKSSHLRPSAELRELVGLVGEIQAYRFLRASFGEDVVTRESWVSEMRSKVIPLVPGEPDNLSDGHGFDFRFRHASKLWHVEVKATTGDDEQFDVSIGEIEVASRLAGDPSKPWRFLRITNALSATPGFEWLPNPFDEKFRKLYRIQKAGMRISYARKAK